MKKVKKMDIFGLPVSLNLGQDTKYRTSIGLFMSCSFYILLFAYLILGPLSFIFDSTKKTFTHLMSNENNGPMDGFYAGNGRFKIAIGLQDKESAVAIKNSKIFGIRAKYEYRDAGNNVTTISYNLKVEPCKTDYFESLEKSKDPKNKDSSQPPVVHPTAELFCLAEDQATLPEEHQGMFVFGRFDSNVQGKIIITIERCKVDCLPKEQIDNRLARSNIVFYMINYGINLSNEKDPFTRGTTGNSLSADSRFTKLQDIFIKRITVESDDGLIAKNQDVKKYVMVDYMTESISSEHDQIIFRTQVQMSNKHEKYNRNYKKLFSVVSEIGGYIKAFVLFAFLYRPFLKRLYYMEIINNLYRLERNKPLANVQIGEEEERKVREGNSVRFREIGQDEADERKEKAAMGDVDDEEEDDDMRDGKKGKGEVESFTLKYNWMDWIAIVCPCLKTKKHKLLDRVVNS